ncbi:MULTISPECIES: hypothetical protein [Prochlorococcus]|uniref:hypothetical protein n=1 Tax=Prochlorococcus TaxID=1218 RepID=UPI000533B703|nr:MULTISPECIES: hypothetical protein [Prochlorococcus]KGG14401.1 hypothetical protein EV05_0008 [Prochlorococcus sp. MIT 0601]
MPENTFPPEPIEAFTIPEGSVLLDDDDIVDQRSFAIAGLVKIVKERNLDLPLGSESDLENPNRLVSFNSFAVQIVTAGINADEITIPLNHWYQHGAAPQLLLACHVDDENNLVWFSGVLTGPEFKEVISNQIRNKNEITISSNEFQGGVDRLLRFVRILEKSTIPRVALDEQTQSQWSVESIKKTLQSGISITVVAAGSVIFGSEIFRPRLIGNIAMLSGDPVEVTSYSNRSLLSFESSFTRKFCLLSPNILNTKGNLVATISIDRPLIFSLEPLNEIKVSRNGVILWRKLRNTGEKLIGPISWPSEVTPIRANEKLSLIIRPRGSSPGEEATILLEGNSQESFQQVNDLVNSLGNKKSKWIRAINQQLKKDKTIALTLLFSPKAPDSKVLEQARSSILSKGSCQKSE